jgi:hypothetical protein
MKILITENQVLFLKLKRRGVDLDKLIDMVDSQSEIQYPCVFDDGEEFADFCIDQAVRFYYKDEGYDDDDEDEEYDDEDEDNDDEDNDDEIFDEIHEVREDVENYLTTTLSDGLISMWEEYMEENECY